MPIVLFFSSRQISAHPIWNFRVNPSTPGRFDNIVPSYHLIATDEILQIKLKNVTQKRRGDVKLHTLLII